MPTARKLPSGSWRCQALSHYDENGKRVYKSFTSDDKSRSGKNKAETMANNFIENRGRKSTSSIEFKDALDNYIKIKGPVLSPTTLKTYKNMQMVFLRDFQKFCNIKISDMDQKDIQKVINKMCEKNSPKTIRNYHGLISAVLKQNGYDRVLLTSMPKKVRPALNIPSDDGIKKLIEYSYGTELEIPIMLAAFGTMRRGEICGLSLDDISNNIVHVHHSYVEGEDKKYYLKAPKTYSSDRYVELPQFVIDRIHEKGYITILKPHSITTGFRKLLEKHEIPLFRFHDLRHYSASILHALGVPDAYIMQRGGWETDVVLKSVYRHAMNDRQKEMNQIANDHFDKLRNTSGNTKK